MTKAIATSVIAALLGAAIIALVSYLLRDPEPVLVNVELIVDASSEMDKKFGESTRFKAAVDELNDLAEAREADNLALWSFGGRCEKRELVDFGQGNDDAIRDALGTLEPQGKADLADTLIAATGDFNDLDRFPPEARKTVIVLTAGRDTCSGGSLREVSNRMEELGEGFNVDFRIFGMDVGRRAKRKLRNLAGPSVEVEFPKDSTDLDLEPEPEPEPVSPITSPLSPISPESPSPLTPLTPPETPPGTPTGSP
jgi:hypothetical protein